MTRHELDQDHQAAARSPGNRKALCIGIDAYPGKLRLACCVADALAWKSTLEQLGFDVDTLLDEAATYDGILASMSEIIEQAQAGDIVTIQYSGHGIQFPDSDNDEEDAQDEAIVPVNSANQYFVSDDELWDVLQSVADGVQLYVFMDCCHSRSNSRSADRTQVNANRRARRVVPNRSMIAAHRERLLPRRSARGIEPKTIDSMRHIKFSACHDSEEAFEENGQGNFTRAALHVLDNLEDGASNADIRLAIEESFVPDARQQPGLECPTHLKRQVFMNGIGAAASRG